jgi:hypothetical protein
MGLTTKTMASGSKPMVSGIRAMVLAMKTIAFVPNTMGSFMATTVDIAKQIFAHRILLLFPGRTSPFYSWLFLELKHARIRI